MTGEEVLIRELASGLPNIMDAHGKPLFGDSLPERERHEQIIAELEGQGIITKGRGFIVSYRGPTDSQGLALQDERGQPYGFGTRDHTAIFLSALRENFPPGYEFRT